MMIEHASQLEQMEAQAVNAAQLRQVVRDEILRAVPQPVTIETQQDPVASAADVAVTGEFTLDAEYDAAWDVVPDNAGSEVVWTANSTGTPTSVNAADLLTITAPTAGDKLFYQLDVAAFAAGTGCLVEAWLQVTDSGTAVNTGQCIAVFDGTWQYVLWLREAGLNIDGEAEVAVTLSDAEHRVLFVTDGEGGCRVFVDSEWLQDGTAANPTAEKAVTFGTWVSTTLS
jgi:hypothetical protein